MWICSVKLEDFQITLNNNSTLKMVSELERSIFFIFIASPGPGKSIDSSSAQV